MGECDGARALDRWVEARGGGRLAEGQEGRRALSRSDPDDRAELAVNDGFALFSSDQHVEQLTAATGSGSGAASSAETLCGAQQAFTRRARSACIDFSWPITARVSRRILAAPAFTGSTIL